MNIYSHKEFLLRTAEFFFGWLLMDILIDEVEWSIIFDRIRNDEDERWEQIKKQLEI